jgi:phosphohistidine swiveling domain-containing protein
MSNSAQTPGWHDTTPLVAGLKDLTAAHTALAGGKGANLGELVRAGFTVPNGFVITTAAYAILLDETGLGATLARLLYDNVLNDNDDDDDDDGAAIRSAFTGTSMPAAIRTEILAAYRKLGAPPVAVRSSATAEDLPGAAFAGQQDTFLNVIGEDALLTAVTNCWASLWTDRAISYRKRRGIDPRDVAIAVVVQEMVSAEAAGVMFTANPVTGARDEIVVDAARGLGEAVVAGLVTPEHYVLGPSDEVREWSPAEQEVEIRSDAGGGTSESASAQSTDRILSPERLSELAGIARRAAEHFGRPQDLEWAVADGTVFVLQTRPMTALPSQPGSKPEIQQRRATELPPAHLNAFQKKLGPFFAEMFQVRPYPLDVDGWLKHGIIAMLHRMAWSVGVKFPGLSKLLPEEDGLVVRLVPPIPHPTLKTLGAPISIAFRVRRYAPALWTQDDRFLAFLRNVAEVKSVDPRELSWPQLLARVRRIFAVTGAIADLRISYLPASFLPQLPLRLLLLALGKQHLASPLIAGAETRTTQANRGLEGLAAEVRQTPALALAFDQLQPAELLHRLSSDPVLGEFNRKFRAFLDEYGHRETVSLVLSSTPTWSDAPEVVLGLISVLRAARPPTVDQTGNAMRELTAHPALRNDWLRRQTLAAVERSKIGTAFRDDSHFYLTLLLPALRGTFLEMGERLRRVGVLDEAADVFHLRFEDLTGMADGASLSPADQHRYCALASSRAAKRAELEGVPLLDLDLLFADRRKAPSVDDGVLVTGLGSSRGSATGPVRIIRDAAEFGSLRSGEILVCPYTNPAWTPLFQRAAAVVVDTGGMGSHAAIVAREYGIPAVMGTRNGTSVLVDGQRVTVDGTSGGVTRG